MPAAPRRRPLGFSLLELMVVVMLVALATALTTLSMRDASQNKLEEEGARLSALLETARTQSRIIGTDVTWNPVDTGGLEFDGLPPAATKELLKRWLDSDTRATIVGAPQIKLGPEPLLPAQRVVLHLGDRDLTVGTDGLTPFQIIDTAAAAPAQ